MMRELRPALRGLRPADGRDRRRLSGRRDRRRRSCAFPQKAERQRDRARRPRRRLAAARPAVLGPRYFWSRPSATGPQPYNGARLVAARTRAPINPALDRSGRAIASRRCARRIPATTARCRSTS